MAKSLELKKKNTETPMMRQYYEIKSKHEDAILFFRLGDFYEMFNDDARIASKELDLTLTARNKSQENPVPLAGIPYHAAENYITKLVNKGYKVVICEQTEDPKVAEGIVKREVVRIVTPGTSLLGQTMSCSDNNFLAAACFSKRKRRAALAYLDITTGEFYSTEFIGVKSEFELISEIVRVRPSELILSENLKDSQIHSIAENRLSCSVSIQKFDSFDEAFNKVCDHFNLVSLDSFGLKDRFQSVIASAMLIDTLEDHKLADNNIIDRIYYYESGDRMHLDAATVMNLEITETIAEKEKNGSLLWVMDKTKTAMGARKLKNWLLKPLSDIESIEARQIIVKLFFDDFSFRLDMIKNLEEIYDIERILSKIAFGSVNGRDLLLLKQSLSAVPNIKNLLIKRGDTFKVLLSQLGNFKEIFAKLEMIREDAPFTIREGNLIKKGHSKNLDELKEISTNGKEYLALLEQKEKQRTGIKSLKVRYNRVFGYYIEVTKSYIDLVPENYIRKQTLANSERFYTEDLKQKEALILGAEDKLKTLEYEIFQGVVEFIRQEISDLKVMASAISEIDVLSNFANVAVDLGWVCPEIKDEGVLEILQGRHPVVDKMLGTGGFVPNDTNLNFEDQIHVITGPNMSGKSTYIRQVALITLLAHSGSFVPATSARIDLVDRIFTRVGASDNLATGLSTFMVEMLETANILNNATSKSLVILDEIGRGTSTFDGISIAWAVTEYLHSKSTIGAKTLFATHYHELIELEKLLKRVKNYNVAVTETGGKVIFLRRILPGSTDKSYGIEVAKLAGLPESVIVRSEEILADLESSNEINPEPVAQHHSNLEVAKEVSSKSGNTNIEFDQLRLFKSKVDPAVEELNNIDLMKVSPLQSLNFLFYLQKLIRGEEIPSPLPLSKGRSKTKFQETIQEQLNLKLFK